MQKKLTQLNAVMKHINSGKLYLFGAGKNGKELLEYLRGCDISVQAFIDNDKTLDVVDGMLVISADEFIIAANENDFILITCAKYEEVERQLQDLKWQNYMYYREVSDLKDILEYDTGKFCGGTCWEKAVSWLLKHKIPNGGISYSSRESRAYPEVTGYLIPTLVEYGFIKEAKDCVIWLLRIQEEDGGYADVNHTKEFIFDTAQILRGFLCFYDDAEIGAQVMNAIEKICRYLYSHMIDGGQGGYRKQYEHDRTIPESILLYTLPPFIKAAELLKRDDYLAAIGNCISFYEKQEDFLRTTDLTHFLAYEMEALIDLGRGEKTEKVLDELFASQMENGAIPSHKNSEWICTPGAAQIGVCELKLGRTGRAAKILGWLQSVQMPSGGFWGSYGTGAEYFPWEEIAWAVKYYLDAEWLYRKRVSERDIQS